MTLIPGADHRVVPTGTGGAARQAVRVLAAGLVAGLLLGAAPLRQWTESVPDNLSWLNRAASGWEATAAAAGLTRPYSILRTALRRIQAP